MDQFLEITKWLKPTPGAINKVNDFTSVKEMESIIKHFQGPESFIKNFFEVLNKELIAIFLISFI